MIYGDWNESEVAFLDATLNDSEKEFINKTAVEWSAMEREQRLYPTYHFTSPHGCLNDPNGLCYWNGYWHLFYQNNFGMGWVWAHAVSRDLVHWKHLPRAILPEVEKECYSGMILIEKDRAIAAYYGLKTGIMIAESKDPLLVRWEKLNGGNPVIPENAPDGTRYLAYDPCIWKNGDKYCLISGKYVLNEHSQTRMRDGYLFISDDLIHWEFKGNFLENDLFANPDDDLACPYFLPCGNRHLLLHFSHHSGPKIMIGDYDRVRNRFVVTGARHLTRTASHFGGLLAPSAFPHPDGDGTLLAIYNVHSHNHMPDGVYNNAFMSLPTTISVEDSGNEIYISPAKELEILRVPESRVCKTDIALTANEPYKPLDVASDTMELILEFEAKYSPMLEIRVMMSEDEREYSAIRIFRQRGASFVPAFGGKFEYGGANETVVQLGTSYSSLDADLRFPEEQAVWIAPTEKLNVRIFLDKSIIEVFVNGKAALTTRVVPMLGGKNIAIVSRGKDIILERLEAYELGL